MCSKKIVATIQVPKAIGPYSKAVISVDLLFASGQLPVGPATERMVDDDIAEQALRVFKNIEAAAKTAGVILQHTTKTYVFLSDINDLKVFNEVYQTYFTLPFTARSAFAVAALPPAGKIEVKAVNTIKTMS